MNDSVLGDPAVQELLAKAESMHLKIEIFNSTDEVGTQLASFKNVASIS